MRKLRPSILECRERNRSNVNCLRTEHRVSDFLWFVLLGGTPFLVACLAIANSSLLWMAGYMGFMLVFGVAQVRFLCTHCPYYSQGGKRVHCKSMWGWPRLFKPRLGALSSLDKAMLYLFFLLAFSFPMYWLVMQPQFLAIYLVSIVVMVLTLARYECSRCMFFDCPFNRAAGDVETKD